MDRKINAAAFKAQCLALIDEVAETGQPITVTKRGKAKVQIVAVREKPKTLIGRRRVPSPSLAIWSVRPSWTTRIVSNARHASSMDSSMILLLGTHTIVWLTEDHPSLGKAARRACDAALAKDEVAISTITYYEIGLQLQRRRIGGPSDLGEWRQRITRMGLREFPVSTDVAIRASGLDDLTGDPADRLIVATALVEDAVLLTADGSLLAWSGGVRRRDAQR